MKNVSYFEANHDLFSAERIENAVVLSFKENLLHHGFEFLRMFYRTKQCPDEKMTMHPTRQKRRKD